MAAKRPAARSSRASRTAGKITRNRPKKEEALQAPDWTPAAAILFNITVKERSDARGENKKVYVRKLLTHAGERRDFTAHAAARAGTKSREIENLMSVLAYHRERVVERPSHARRVAARLSGQAVSVGGTTATVAPAPEHVHAAPAAASEVAWAEARATHPRPRPRLAPRPTAIWHEIVPDPAAWPPHAVIVPERAASRLRAHRAKAGPDTPLPDHLKSSLVHTGRLPTAVASAGDHFLMARTGEWASLAQMLGAFGVSPSSPASATMLSSRLMTERQWTECVGRAVAPDAAVAVMRRIEPSFAGRMPRAPVYASACAGVDFFAVAMDTLYDDWTYSAAWEIMPKLRKFLVKAYAPRGLTAEHVYRDAGCVETARAAPGSDIYIVTPPCGDISKRNHHRTVESVSGATSVYDAMLEFVHVHRPLVVVIENVDMPEFAHAALAALAALDGYDIQMFRPVCPHMARGRVYATAVRRV